MHKTRVQFPGSALNDVAWLQERHDWPGLKAVIMVESTREMADKIETETRFYITSLVWLAHLLGPVVRGHWSIENSLHWLMTCYSAMTNAVSAPITLLPISPPSNTSPTT